MTKKKRVKKKDETILPWLREQRRKKAEEIEKEKKHGKSKTLSRE